MFGIGEIIAAGINQTTDVGMGLYNDYRSRKNAKKAYERQLEFSSTAHQREVADLIAAGLNPILSVHGNGAASVSVPSAGNPGMKSSSNYGQTINSARLVANQNKLMEAQQNQANSIAASNKADAELTSAKTVSQKAHNVLDLGKSDYFKNLPKGVQYDVVNAMLYPGSMAGQIRGLGSALADGIVETGKNVGRAFLPENITTDEAISLLIDELRDQEAGSQAGHNSARKVKTSEVNRKKVKEFFEMRNREEKRKDREFFNKHMKGKVL